MFRTRKRKLILTKSQEERLSSWIGACRLVYNMGLEIKRDSYKKLHKSVHVYELSKQIAPLRKEVEWISDLPFQILATSLQRLDRAFASYFREKRKVPRFISKKSGFQTKQH